jgi:hypothetical protein
VAVTTDVRTTIRDALAEALGLDFVDGKIEGPLMDVEIGCIWPETFELDEADANFCILGIVARVLLAYSAPMNQTDPQDPADLETLAEAISVTVATVASSSLSDYWIVVHGAQFDVEAWLVDVSISVRIPNPYDPG